LSEALMRPQSNASLDGFPFIVARLLLMTVPSVHSGRVKV
jgi:hypothetical protein